MHAGTDFSGRRGDPVFAVKQGTVALVTQDENPRGMAGYGNAIVISHDNGAFYTLYAHLDWVGVTEGQTVYPGQLIGRIGNSTNGQFSPLRGQDAREWTARARARGYNSGPMIPHLHFEVRRAAAGGGAPFPGPYPRSPEDAQNNIDPVGWLRDKGIVFTRRGGIELTPGGAADRSRAQWEPLLHQARNTAVAGLLDGLGGLGDLGQAKGGALAPSSGLPPPGLKVPGGYEPVTFERDGTFGLTPTEWAVLGVGGALSIVGIGAVIWQQRMSPNRVNRKLGRRARRLRRNES